MVKILWVLLLIPGVFAGFTFVNQPNMVFFPIKELRGSPGSWGMRYEDVKIGTDEEGVQLHGWFIPSPADRKTLLFFHGNAGNISHREETITLFNRAGLNVFIVDYRGYGNSTGEPSEEGVYNDARSAWKYLTETRGIASKDIIIFGRSLGGVIATQLASEVSAGGLIVESTFSSAKDMARHLMPYLSRIIYLRYKFDAAETIQHVEIPLLVMHSPGDDIIPFKMGRKVFDAANEPKKFFELRGGHNSGFMETQPEYQQALDKFIASLTQ